MIRPKSLQRRINSSAINATKNSSFVLYGFLFSLVVLMIIFFLDIILPQTSFRARIFPSAPIASTVLSFTMSLYASTIFCLAAWAFLSILMQGSSLKSFAAHIVVTAMSNGVWSLFVLLLDDFRWKRKSPIPSGSTPSSSSTKIQRILSLILLLTGLLVSKGVRMFAAVLVKEGSLVNVRQEPASALRYVNLTNPFGFKDCTFSIYNNATVPLPMFPDLISDLLRTGKVEADEAIAVATKEYAIGGLHEVYRQDGTEDWEAKPFLGLIRRHNNSYNQWMDQFLGVRVYCDVPSTNVTDLFKNLPHFKLDSTPDPVELFWQSVTLPETFLMGAIPDLNSETAGKNADDKLVLPECRYNACYSKERSVQFKCMAQGTWLNATVKRIRGGSADDSIEVSNQTLIRDANAELYFFQRSINESKSTMPYWTWNLRASRQLPADEYYNQASRNKTVADLEKVLSYLMLGSLIRPRPGNGNYSFRVHMTRCNSKDRGYSFHDAVMPNLVPASDNSSFVEVREDIKFNEYDTVLWAVVLFSFIVILGLLPFAYQGMRYSMKEDASYQFLKATHLANTVSRLLVLQQELETSMHKSNDKDGKQLRHQLGGMWIRDGEEKNLFDWLLGASVDETRIKLDNGRIFAEEAIGNESFSSLERSETVSASKSDFDTV